VYYIQALYMADETTDDHDHDLAPRLMATFATDRTRFLRNTRRSLERQARHALDDSRLSRLTVQPRAGRDVAPGRFYLGLTASTSDRRRRKALMSLTSGGIQTTPRPAIETYLLPLTAPRVWRPYHPAPTSHIARGQTAGRPHRSQWMGRMC
jgi:hypothetical protein